MDARFKVSSWVRDKTSSLLTLRAQDGAKIIIQGDGSAAALTLDGTSWTIENAASRRRLSTGAPSPACKQLYSSTGELYSNCQATAGANDDGDEHYSRRLARRAAFLSTSGSFTLGRGKGRGNRGGND